MQQRYLLRLRPLRVGCGVMPGVPLALMIGLLWMDFFLHTVFASVFASGAPYCEFIVPKFMTPTRTQGVPSRGLA